MNQTKQRIGVVLGVLVVAGLFAWIQQSEHRASPEFAAEQQIGGARADAAAGRWVEAASSLRNAISVGSERAGDAKTALREIIETFPADLAPDDIRAIVTHGIDAGIDPEVLLQRSLEIARARAADEPRVGIEIADACALLIAERLPEAPQRYAAAREGMVQEAARASSTDPWVASELALYAERTGDAARCMTLLAPLREQLATHEGARILGQIDVRSGRIEQAFVLLEPYVASRLDTLREAEADYRERVKAGEARALGVLNDGEAPPEWYEAHKNAGPDQQRQMTREFVMATLKSDTQAQRAYQAWIRAGSVVPVGLDLAMVRLERARRMKTPADRQTELQAAETTFLALRGLAGGDVRYMMSLGQVKFWLGKPDEGQALLSQALTASGGSFDVLLAAAGVLREVGEVTQMRALLEPAYEQAPELTQKQAIASLMHAAARDIDESILWLGRANTNDPGIAAALSSQRGQRAMRDGDAEAAEEHLRAAAAAYEGLPPVPATLNNCGLAYLTLFSMTGQKADLDAAAARLLAAVEAAQGDDSVLLANTVGVLGQVAALEQVSEQVDLPLLRGGCDLRALRALYADQPGHDAVLLRLRGSPQFARARRLVERLLVLAPQNPDAFAIAARLLWTVEDDEALIELAERCDAARLDVADRVATIRKARTPETRAESRESALRALPQLEKRLSGALGSDNAPTRALAQTSLVMARLSTAWLGGDVDLESTVELARRAHADAPSLRSHETLCDALLTRAARRLAAAHVEVAQVHALSMGTVTAPIYMAAIIQRGGVLGDAVSADEDVQRVFDLTRDKLRALPGRARPRDWALLAKARPEAGQHIADRIRVRGASLAANRIDVQCSPASTHDALALSWALRATGDDKQADAVLAACVRAGGYVPFASKQ